MPLIIQKYGGKTLATPADILHVARQVHARAKSGTEVVVVVSALADTTDQYVALARAVNPDPRGRELDVLLSTGERVAIAMLALALNSLEADCAVSLTGAQAGIITDTLHTAARIVEVRPPRVREALDHGQIPVIAGYQGITTDKNISTLGRGGTDATAVALAVALGAECVEFMKDVDGVASADPKHVPTARLLPEIDYQDALAMMGLGAKILQVPAVEMGAEFGMKLAIGNSKTGVAGTIITHKPLARRTLGAVVQTPAMLLPLDRAELAFVNRTLRETGLLPLYMRSGERPIAVFKASDEPELLFPEFSTRFSSKFDLIGLFGPGAGGVGALADQVAGVLAPFRASLGEELYLEDRLLVLVERAAAPHLVRCLHDLSVSATAVPGGQ
ncbi:MAG: aspartate kinase [bacterium]|nr:aspartate kinase [bacterium]